jgi:hypothetical protein
MRYLVKWRWRLFRKTVNVAPRSKLRGIKAEFAAALPAFALTRFGAVHLAFHPCSKLQGIQAKANKFLLT